MDPQKSPKGNKAAQLAGGFSLPKSISTPAVSETAAQAFEGTAKTEPQKGKTPIVDSERINAYIPTSLSNALRKRCFEDRRSMSDALREAISDWLARPAKKP